jgi:hypothetical protein
LPLTELLPPPYIMSYAEMAAKGPKQSPEEARAPAQPQVEHASDDSVHSLVDVDSPHISSVPSDYESQEIKTDTQAERIEREEEIKEEVKNVKERAAAKKDAAKEKVKKNADNPVVLSNAVGLAVVGGIVGFGAYRQYVRGELTGKVVAAWAAVIGLFGVGDYYVSQFFFKRNPPK